MLAAAGEWRMMHGDDERLGILVLRVGLAIAREALELAGKERELICADGGVAKRADGFSGVGVEADDADEGRIEGEVDAGLRHGGAIEAGRALRGARGAEVIDEGFARVAGRLALEHETVVVAGDGEDGAGVVAIGLVKLFGIVSFLAQRSRPCRRGGRRKPAGRWPRSCLRRRRRERRRRRAVTRQYWARTSVA